MSKQNEMPVLKLSDADLSVVLGSNGAAQTLLLTVTNDCPKRMGFKIKVTNNERFRVKPSLGIVAGSGCSQVSITVRLPPMKQKPAKIDYVALLETDAGDQPCGHNLWATNPTYTKTLYPIKYIDEQPTNGAHNQQTTEMITVPPATSMQQGALPTNERRVRIAAQFVPAKSPPPMASDRPGNQYQPLSKQEVTLAVNQLNKGHSSASPKVELEAVKQPWENVKWESLMSAGRSLSSCPPVPPPPPPSPATPARSTLSTASSDRRSMHEELLQRVASRQSLSATGSVSSDALRQHTHSTGDCGSSRHSTEDGSIDKKESRGACQAAVPDDPIPLPCYLAVKKSQSADSSF